LFESEAVESSEVGEENRFQHYNGVQRSFKLNHFTLTGKPIN